MPDSCRSSLYLTVQSLKYQGSVTLVDLIIPSLLGITLMVLQKWSMTFSWCQVCIIVVSNNSKNALNVRLENLGLTMFIGLSLFTFGLIVPWRNSTMRKWSGYGWGISSWRIFELPTEQWDSSDLNLGPAWLIKTQINWALSAVSQNKSLKSTYLSYIKGI